MNATSNAKWLLAKGGILGLASFFALGVHLSAAPNAPDAKTAAPNRASAGNSSERMVAPHVSSQDKRAAAINYARLPIGFEPVGPESKGEAKFLARGSGYVLFLTNTEAVLELREKPDHAAVVRMKLDGANREPSLQPLEALPGKSNYFIGNDPKSWRRNVPQYRKVSERNVYPGIDLVYYGTQGQLEYDFDVAPGFDPSAIRIAFQGAHGIKLDADGELVISSAAGDVRLRKPIAYQEISGTRHLVAANYSLGADNSVHFKLAKYDAGSPLVIDPILIYSSYLGGNNIDFSNAIAIAPDKTAFIAGSTFSSNFPTVHALQPNEGGGVDFPQDAFVTKISADGSAILYSTYLGGENTDVANGIAVDSFGNAFVTGTTLSPHFPNTPNVFGQNCGFDGQCGASFNGGGLIVSNAFVAKLNVAGSQLIYSGFLGYYEYVQGNAIAIDASGNAYVTGRVGPNIPPTVTITPPKVPPPPFPDQNAIVPPTVVGGFDFGIPGTSNAYVTEISASGAGIVYSTYLGGSDEDFGAGIAVDASGLVYVAGQAKSIDFPVVGALQPANRGNGDAFLTKINPNPAFTGLASVIYSTFLGGSGVEQANSVAVDNSGNAYIAGVSKSISSSLGFVPPAGSIQSNCVLDASSACEGDAFVAKINTNSTGVGSLVYFTYLGGSKADSATGIAIDSAGNAYITGSTVSTDFPTAGAVFQPAYGGGNADSFVAKLNPAGTALIYSSYLGGTNTEVPTGIAVDADGSAYVTGQTCSEDFPLANPFQSVPGGNCDAYISKVTILGGFDLNPAGLVFGAQSLHTSSQPQTVTLTNGDVAQTITSIAITGANAADFADTTTCGAPLAVGATCTFTVTFTPSGSGIRKAQIVVTDSAPGSPHIINLTGNTSEVSLSTSNLAFGFQDVNVPSSPQKVTVTNSGSTPLTISFISASGDFTETDNCTKVPLPSSGTCNIQVVFDPSAAIASVGAITITDSGAGSPQVILATGTGVQPPPFSVTPLTGTASVTAGKSAQYGLAVTSESGFSNAVALTCNAPATLVCSISPSVVTPTASQSLAAVLTVSSALRTSAPPSFGLKFDPPAFLRPFGGTALLWMLAALLALTAASVRRRPLTATFGFAVVLLLASVACGGGAAGVPAGTPAGTYQVTVTGTSGSVNQSIPVTLHVN